MTEILDSGDARREQPNEWTNQLPYDLPAADDEPYDLESDEPGRWSLAVRSVTDPASLAVAAVLSVLCAAVAGPSYVFQAYPFNQGIDNLTGVFDLRGATEVVRPLHAFLINAAPTVALVALALVCAVLSLLRLRPDAPSWARPAAAGALVVALALGALVAAGGYRASSLDLTVPSAVASATG